MKRHPMRVDIKNNLLGGLEIALFMPSARTRFGNTREQAVRSFIIPVLLFPLTMMAVWLSPQAGGTGNAAHLLAALYLMRMVAGWALFYGMVYWIAHGIDRREHFHQFVTASNWLTVPATAVYIPIIVLLLQGGHSWDALYPYMMCLMLYTYAFTAYMAVNVLRVPWEMAGFIVFCSIYINDRTFDVVHWVGGLL